MGSNIPIIFNYVIVPSFFLSLLEKKAENKKRKDSSKRETLCFTIIKKDISKLKKK